MNMLNLLAALLSTATNTFIWNRVRTFFFQQPPLCSNIKLLAVIGIGFIHNLEDPISKSLYQCETSVRAHMIIQFSIPNRICFKSYPCRHVGCKISLFDGREKTVSLNGAEIQALIESIEPDKVYNPLEAHHFQNFKTASIDVDVLLSKIFNDYI